MERTIKGIKSTPRGIQIHASDAQNANSAKSTIFEWFSDLGLQPYLNSTSGQSSPSGNLSFSISEQGAEQVAPDGDTSVICRNLNLDSLNNSKDLEREILFAMLICPVPFQFRNLEEFQSTVRVRKSISQAAAKTSLSFATDEAERPEEYWTYDEDRGFILRPGKSLIEAIRLATQPEASGKRYTFSCRRAAEYIVQLAIAIESRDHNTALFQQLEQQARARALKGREFESIFHRQIGSLDNPLPVKYFIPGDRTWFRNPEPISSTITGYEGSWTFYIGNGIFADFWRPDQAYSLETKCLSIYHWRNATFKDSEGELQIDEARVESHMEKTLNDSTETNRIINEMLRLQAPLDTYAGGCVEAHRECVKDVSQGSTDLKLPDIEITRSEAKR